MICSKCNGLFIVFSSRSFLHRAKGLASSSTFSTIPRLMISGGIFITLTNKLNSSFKFVCLAPSWTIPVLFILFSMSCPLWLIIACSYNLFQVIYLCPLSLWHSEGVRTWWFFLLFSRTVLQCWLRSHAKFSVCVSSTIFPSSWKFLWDFLCRRRVTALNPFISC